jgi:hypothetical protein
VRALYHSPDLRGKQFSKRPKVARPILFFIAGVQRIEIGQNLQRSGKPKSRKFLETVRLFLTTNSRESLLVITGSSRFNRTNQSPIRFSPSRYKVPVFQGIRPRFVITISPAPGNLLAGVKRN